jgi:hypothetical protein
MGARLMDAQCRYFRNGGLNLPHKKYCNKIIFAFRVMVINRARGNGENMSIDNNAQSGCFAILVDRPLSICDILINERVKIQMS